MPEGLIRQRRNLIIASCLVWFFQLGNVTVTTVTYSDIALHIGDRNSVYLAIWVFYFYSLQRFFVYFVEDGWGDFVFAFRKAIDEACLAKVESSLRVMLGGESLPTNDCLMISESRVSGLTLVFAVQTEDENIELKVSVARLISCFIKGGVIFLFFRAAVTDYIFPFLLAFYVLFVPGLSNWPGSLINILKGGV